VADADGGAGVPDIVRPPHSWRVTVPLLRSLLVATDTLTRDQVRRRLAEVDAEIFGLGVRRLALFGSVLRNEARPDSDVDFLVEFAPGRKSFDRFLALSELLEERLDHSVELVTTEALSPFLGPHILAEAVDVVRAA